MSESRLIQRIVAKSAATGVAGAGTVRIIFSVKAGSACHHGGCGASRLGRDAGGARPEGDTPRPRVAEGEGLEP